MKLIVALACVLLFSYASSLPKQKKNLDKNDQEILKYFLMKELSKSKDLYGAEEVVNAMESEEGDFNENIINEIAKIMLKNGVNIEELAQYEKLLDNVEKMERGSPGKSNIGEIEATDQDDASIEQDDENAEQDGNVSSEGHSIEAQDEGLSDDPVPAESLSEGGEEKEMAISNDNDEIF